MRLIYICDSCERYIDEIELREWDETSLGFDALTNEEKDELLHIDWQRQVGTVRAICDACWQEKELSAALLSSVDYSPQSILH